MTRTNNIILAALLLGAPATVAAQNGAAPANVVTPAPAPREGTVGPEQLRDFALPGTRPATAAPPPAEVQRPAPAPQPTTSTPVTPAPRPAATAQARAEPRNEPARQVSEVRAEPSEAGTPAPSGASLPPATAAPSEFLPLPQIAEPVSPIVVTQPSVASPSLLPGWWPWALVAMLAGIGLALVLRQRRKLVPAGPGAETFELRAPEPDVPALKPAAAPRKEPAPPNPLPAGLVTTRLRQPSAPPPVPAPSPSAPASAPVSGGVVSRRLRGWIDIDLVVREILIDEAEAILRVDLMVINNGTGAARDIALEAVTTNASEDQAAELMAFFERPAAASVAISELGPLSDTTLRHELRMPRTAIRAYEAQGRTLFVPVVAFNAIYRTASAEGRTSAAFLVGRDVPGSEKLAPLLLAEGEERLLGPGIRRLEEAVRR